MTSGLPWRTELRKLPNRITCARIVLTAVLYAPAHYGARALFLSGYDQARRDALAAAVAIKSGEEAAICLLVPDPYADPRRSLLAYLRR